MTTPIAGNDLEWTDGKYGCYSAKVGCFRLHVTYQNDKNGQGYRVAVNETALKAYEPDLEVAKAKAIKLALRLANEVMAVLDQDID